MRIIKEADIRKNEILDAAGILFTEKGYDNTSVTDIMNAVGIAKGTLYHHYKSKEDILNALMAIPNLIAVLLLSNVIVKETKKYINDLDAWSDEEVPVTED